MKLIILTFTLAISILIPELARAGASDLRRHQLHQLFADSGFRGTVKVTQNGTTMFHHAYGMAVKEWKIPNDLNTRFRIASLSKTFTEVIVMKLAEEGRLDIDEPLKRYLPGFPAGYGGKVTLRHLLTHRSGIPRLFNIPGWASGKSNSPLAQKAFLSMIADLPVKWDAGAKRQYSSANYYLLGVVIEQVTGQTYGQVLQEKILKPLNMNNTDIYRPGQLVSSLANPYKNVKGKYSFCPNVQGDFCSGGNINLMLFMASGSMYSTTGDLAIWAQALDGNLLLSKSSKAFLFNPETQASWNVQMVELESNYNLKLLVADGELEGNSSLIIKLPEAKISIVMLNNTGMEYRNKVELGLKTLSVLL